MSREVLHTLCKRGELDKALDLLSRVNTPPSSNTYLSLLKVCSKKGKGSHVQARRVHAHIARHGVQLSGLLGDYLVVVLAKCGAIEDARLVSAKLPYLTVFSWTALINAYADHGRPQEALRLHQCMQEKGVEPNTHTFVTLFKACGCIPDLEQGIKFHADACKKGFTSNVMVSNTLVSMYGKCGDIAKAEDVFGALAQRTLTSWNAMLSAYVEEDLGEKALWLYTQMQEEGVEPSTYTYVTLFKACGSIGGELRKGKDLHVEAHRKGFTSDVFVGNTLVSMYGKCGAIVEAEDVFSSLPQRTLVSWNAMLSAYIDQGQGEKALCLYRQMQQENESPDQPTFVIALQACAILAEMELHSFEGQSTKVISLEIGQALHANARKKSYMSNVLLSNTLLSIYGKCGAIVEAENVFGTLPQRTVVAWNAMLSAYVELGQADMALQLYTEMEREGMRPDHLTFVLTLKACSTLAALFVEGGFAEMICLKIGQALHAEAQRIGLASDLFIGSTLVSMYGKCGAIVEAEDVFCALCERTVVSWNAMLSAYVEQGQGEKALRLYTQMLEEGVFPHQLTCMIALQACATLAEEGQCAKVMSLEIGQALHADAHRKGFTTNLFVSSTLVSMYGKCGAIVEAEVLFSASSHLDVVSWSAMLSGYVEEGQGEKSLQLYTQMQKEGMSPNPLTFVSALQACATLAEKEAALFQEGHSTKVMPLEIGQALHADACKKGYTSLVFVGNTLVNMYHKCGAIAEAEDIFGALSHRTIMSWNAMLSAYVEQGQGEKALQLYTQMQEEGTSPDQLTSLMALRACASLAEKDETLLVEEQPATVMSLEIGQALHSDICRKGFACDVFVGSALVSLYGKWGAIVEAEDVFEALTQHDVVSWSAMLSAYVVQGQGAKALQLYTQMQEEGVGTDQSTFVIALQACATLGEKEDTLLVEGRSAKLMPVEIGQALHSDARRKGFSSDLFVGSTLVSIYGKCRAIPEAENVFEGLSYRDVVAWNEMLSAYAEQCQGENALRLYVWMQEEGMNPDQWTFIIILQACTALAEKEDVVDGLSTNMMALEIGQALHVDACREGLACDTAVGSTLVSMYGKCGALAEAEDVFSSVSQRTIVPWNVLLSAYIGQGQGEKALWLYGQMQRQSVTRDHVTVICILQACSATGSLDICAQLHCCDIVSAGCDQVPSLAATLIHAYGSCASVVDAQALFDNLLEPDIVAWNACISGHAGEGNCVRSLQLFEKMNFAGIKPNKVTFASVLSACRHAGLVKGFEYFESMSRDYGMTPDLKHYGSLVDLLGRAGDFKRIESIMGRMPTNVTLTVWLCLLGACRTHGNLELAKQAFDCAVSVQPKQARLYVLMSNIYADAGLQEGCPNMD